METIYTHHRQDMGSQKFNLVYDFSITGYDTTIIKALGGTPSLVSSKLRLNAAEACTFGFWKRCVVEMTVNVPVVPTAGHTRSWGLKVPALGNRGRAEFEISGTTFRCVAYDDKGGSILSQNVAWDGTWTAADVRFKIDATGRFTKFYVNEVLVATASDRSSLPCAIHANNAVADNMDSTAWVCQDADSFN